MSFREMFLAEHPIDGEQILEEARIKAAKGSALFDALETHMKQELLSTLRERVEKEIDYFCEVMHITYETAAIEEGWRTQEITRGEWENSPESNKETMRKSVRAVLLSLLTEIEGEMK